MIKVGTNSFGYNHWRNFAGLPFQDVVFKKVFDLYKIPAHYHFKLHNRVVQKYINRFNDFGLNRVDLYHFFNTITPIRRPWIVTYETYLPRLDEKFEAGFQWMAGKYCKAIIGYTQRALDSQKYTLQRFPQYQQAIESKLLLIYPSQKLIVPSLAGKRFDREIIFTITGSVFFLKGGWELLLAFERLKNENAPVRLYIISKLEVHGYKDEHATPELVARSRAMIANNPLITHFNGLPNSEVVEILKQSHVGILPSYGETFGYSLLEAMACGCAVVSTSVAPFPEFIKDPWGWLINVPVTMKDGVEYTDTENPEAYSKLTTILEHGIYETVKTVISDRSLLKQKCENAIQRIKEFYDPQDRAKRLRELYNYALQ